MSHHYFGGTDNAALRTKIHEAKEPTPECGEDDEIDFLAKAKGIDVKEATTRRARQLIDRYLMTPNKRFSRVVGRDKGNFWFPGNQQSLCPEAKKKARYPTHRCVWLESLPPDLRNVRQLEKG